MPLALALIDKVPSTAANWCLLLTQEIIVATSRMHFRDGSVIQLEAEEWSLLDHSFCELGGCKPRREAEVRHPHSGCVCKGLPAQLHDI
ncbi:hypothetical protein WJX77_005261 [Trebouxia sp. C0004]